MKLPEGLVGRRIPVNDRPIHFVDSAAGGGRGSGAAPVVLVHGVGLSHRYMVPTARLLADDHRVLVPDLPGFGLSYKPRPVLDLDTLADWLADWLRAVGPRRAAWLGNSVGCQVIVRLAVRHASVVDRAILQGPTVDPAARSFPGQVVRWHRNRQMEGRRRKGPIVLRDYAECGLRRIVRTFAHAMEDPVEVNLPRMECPTLVVRGERDPIVSPRWAAEVAELLPRGRLVTISGNVSHTLNFEVPEKLVEVVEPFLADERPGDGEAADPAVEESPQP